MVEPYFIPKEAEAYGFSENAGGFPKEKERRFFLTRDRIRIDIGALEEDLEDANGDAQLISKRIAQLKGREVKIRNYFLRGNMKLVRALSARFSKKFLSVDIEDIFSAGQEKLFEGWDKFDVNRNVKFSTYYGRSLYNTVSRIALVGRRSVSLDDEVTEDGLSKYEVIEDPYSEEPSSQAADKDTKDWIEEHLDILSSRERYVVRRRFGLYRRAGGRREKASTLDAVGNIIKLTKERVRQVEKNALRKINIQADMECSTDGFIS